MIGRRHSFVRKCNALGGIIRDIQDGMGGEVAIGRH